MKVIVCGDRNWRDADLICDRLSKLPKDTIVIQGGANGADFWGKYIAERLGLEVKSFLPNWGQYGKAAGPIRNRRMLQEKPDLVLAFHDSLKDSKGTKDMVNAARKAGVTVEIISHDSGRD